MVTLTPWSSVAATDFHLICEGGGAAVTHHSVNDFACDSNGQTVAGTANFASDRHYADQVEVEIVGAAGRRRLPPGLLPTVKAAASNSRT